MNTLSKSDLVALVAKSTDNSKTLTETIISSFLDTIMSEVASGNEIKITGILGITKVIRSERNGVNPKTKEKIVIPASNAVAIKVGKTFKEMVKASK